MGFKFSFLIFFEFQILKFRIKSNFEIFKKDDRVHVEIDMLQEEFAILLVYV